MLLSGAIVQRVETAPYGAILRVRAPGETLLLLVVAGRDGTGVGLIAGDERTRVRFAGFEKAAAPIEGARIAGIGELGVALLAHDTPWAIVIDRASRRVVVRPGALDGLLEGGPEVCEALRARGEGLFAAIATEALERSREALVLALERAGKRIERRIAAIGQDLARVGEADALSAQAQWFMAEATKAPRGARSIAVTDWSSGEPRPLELALDPAKSALEQVQALFKRARRIKRGVAIAEDRRAQAESRRAILGRLLEDARAESSCEALDTLSARARSAAPGDFVAQTPAAVASRKKSQPRRLAFRTFHAENGARILVGRGAADNDALTLHVARPHDHWLHARGQTGAHVVVPLDKGHTCPPEVLIDAAHLAAHFSDARGESVAEIEHTPRRYVRKPRGSKPGLVVVEREKVLTLRMDPARVTRLVASETDSAEA